MPTAVDVFYVHLNIDLEGPVR